VSGRWIRSCARPRGCGYLAGAPGVQRIVDERAAGQQCLVVGFHVQTAGADGQQARAERVGIQVRGDVRGVDDPREPGQRRVIQAVFGDEGFEGCTIRPARLPRAGG
jgi:hypothetical protein